MTVFEVLIFNRELIERLSESGIRLDDARFVDLYIDYNAMLEDGDKVSYVVAFLSKKYGVSVRKVYGLIKRFKSDCKPRAA